MVPVHFFFKLSYSHSSPWNFWSFPFFWLTFITSKCMYFIFFRFFVSLYSHGVHSCRSSVSISTFIRSYNEVPIGNKGSKILTDILGVGLWQNYQCLYWISSPPQDGFPKSPIITLVCHKFQQPKTNVPNTIFFITLYRLCPVDNRPSTDKPR